MLNLETLHGRPARHSHQWPQPDTQKIARWMRTYLRVVAVQGTMQVGHDVGIRISRQSRL